MKRIICLIFPTLLAFFNHQASASTSVDLIVYGDYVVTMEENTPVINHGAVVIKGNDIVFVGSQAEANANYDAKRVIAGKNKILMPGLINGHNHSAMVLFRGMADDLKLMTWLTEFVFPMEGQFVDAELIRVGSRLACWEMIRGGTTTFVDMYFYPDTIAEVVDECGMRAVIAAPSIDFPSPGFKGWDDSFAAAIDFVTRWQDKNERITPAFAPHAPYTVSPEHIAEVAAQARRLNAPVSMHIAEAPTEITDIAKRYNTTPVKHVAKQGLLQTQLIAAHMVHPTTEEIALLAKHKIGAIHNPTSNLKLAAGISPVPEMLAAGVAVGLGTDGAASNNDLDMWEEIQLAALIHKNNKGDPTIMPSFTALQLATSSGARSIGQGELIGTLTVGKRADMIQIDIDSPKLTPLYNVISQLVYAVDSDDVVTSIVSGRILMENATVLTLDAQQVREDALEITRKIQQQLDQKK